MSKELTQDATAICRVTSFAALAGANNLAEVVQTNLGGRGASMYDLERIQIAAGGAPSFVLRDAIDGESMAPALRGIITFWRDQRTYWASDYGESGGGSPPDCTSVDTRIGRGNNGDGQTSRPCATCPHDVWGSAREGRGKACRQTRALFLLRETREQSLFPSLLLVPPTSLSTLHRWLFALTGRGIPYYRAVVELSIQAATSDAGYRYGQLQVRLARTLSEEDGASVRAYAECMQPAFAAVDVWEEEQAF